MKPFASAALRAALSVTLAGVLAASAAAQALPEGDAETLGFSSERLAAIDEKFTAAVDAGDMPGALIMITRHGQVAHFASMGKRAPDGEEMTRDSIFRIYSMTKPIVSVAALRLAEQGKLDISWPVSALIPEFKEMTVATGADADGKAVTEPAKGQMTVQDLLRHTSGLTYGFFGAGPAREAYKAAGVGDAKLTNLEAAKQLAGLPLEHQPGTTWEYSRSTDVLGAVVEIVSGKPLGEALKELVLDPLNMKDTGFAVSDEAEQARIAEAFPEHAKIGQFDMFDPRVHDAFESGGGGMVSTIDDYSRFAQMLLNGGELDGTRVLSPETVRWMTSDHLGDAIKPGKYYLPGPGYGFGLGVAVRLEDGVSPFNGRKGEYNWGGAAGTYWWNDPASDMSVVFMMQAPPSRVKMRAWLKNMVYAAMTEEAMD